MSNSIACVATKPSWIATNKPLALACLPMLAVLIVIIGISVYETTEERRFHARVRQMRSEGTPVDAASLVEWTRARTRSEGTIPWSEISVMEHTLSQLRRESPSRHTNPEEKELERALFLGVNSLKDERVTRHLEKLRPLFKSVEQAVEFPAPVMNSRVIDPIVRVGFDDVSRDLILELMHALYHRHVERATTSMDLLFRVHDVQKPKIDVDMFVGDFSYRGNRSEHNAIGRSLCVDLWDEGYVHTLIERLKPDRALGQRWRSMVVRNRALGLEEIPHFSDELESQVQRHDGAERQLVRFSPYPRAFMTGSVKNWLLDGCKEFERVADEGYSRIKSRAEGIDKKYFGGDGNRSFLFVQTPYQFRRLYNESWNYIDNENQRRLVRTALAVKFFEMTKGHWPKSLVELSEIEFSVSETQTVGGERFGFEVDGESAFVWLYRAPFPVKGYAGEKRFPIVSNLKSIKVPLEEVDGSELVRIR